MRSCRAPDLNGYGFDRNNGKNLAEWKRWFDIFDLRSIQLVRLRLFDFVRCNGQPLLLERSQ